VDAGRTVLLALALAAVAAAAPASSARDGTIPPRSTALARAARAPIGARQDPSPEALPSGEMGPRTTAALERGLAWLAARQAEQRDGSFPKAGGRRYVPVPIAALSALAFMAGGSTPERGPHGRELALAIDYLLQRVDLRAGSATRGYIASEGDDLSQMHGHGFATLALAEAYAMSPRTTRGRRTAEALEAAVALIQKSQGLEGGWYYEPRAMLDHENSVTVCLVQALRGARNAGVQVDARVIERAVEYVGRCQDEKGAFRYRLDLDKTSVALTAAGIATLNSAGRYGGGELNKALEVLWRQLALRETDERAHELSAYPFYERLYLAQALWQASDRRLFELWAAKERERVLAAQLPDGSWSDENFGASYATAMNCLFLALPLGLLPIFQR
jgi:hypothetical protein